MAGSIPNKTSSMVGQRHVWLEIVDGSSTPKREQIPVLGLTLPCFALPEMLIQHLEGVVRFVFPGNDKVAKFGGTVPWGFFADPTKLSLEQIVHRYGAAASWTPVNDLVSGVGVDSSFPVYIFNFYADGRGLGAGEGRYTMRSCYGVLELPENFDRADPVGVPFTGMVFGTVTPSLAATPQGIGDTYGLG